MNFFRVVISLMVVLQSCIPSFGPDKVTVKEIKKSGITLKWINPIGILDQNFSDYILIQKGVLIDTICESHNIADLKIKNDTVTIGFYGIPKRYEKLIVIPDEVLGSKIAIDTSWLRE